MTVSWPRCAHGCGSPAEWIVTDEGVTVLVCPRGAMGMTGEKRRLSIADVPGYSPAEPLPPKVHGSAEDDAPIAEFPGRKVAARVRRSVALSGA